MGRGSWTYHFLIFPLEIFVSIRVLLQRQKGDQVEEQQQKEKSKKITFSTHWFFNVYCQSNVSTKKKKKKDVKKRERERERKKEREREKSKNV